MKSKALFVALTSVILFGCNNESVDGGIQNAADSIAPLAEELTSEINVPITPQDEPVTVRTVEFPSLDSLMITADIYTRGASDDPYMLLCHQAGFSRGEYKETAYDLVDRQFNCMAIDQRSGNMANDVKNETAARAKKAKLGQGYIDAEQDIVAAINYLHDLSGKPVVIVGSSYSSSLVLKVGKGNPKVKAIISFSPGEYYKKHSVQSWADGMDKPLFVTSSKDEGEGVAQVVINVSGDYLTHFIPKESGVHGSRALWPTQDNNEEYWTALDAFLAKLK